MKSSNLTKNNTRMAKINHYNFVDTVNDMLVEAKKRGVIQLKYNSDSWDGNEILVNEHMMVNFGTCGYLGLEIHPKIVEKSIAFTRDFGSQFSVSRAYLTSKSNFLLEEYLSAIFFGRRVISFTSTTLAHLAVVPILISSNDLIILDQQCHVSIQTATQLMASKGVSIEMIRHNRLDMLEHKIQKTRNKYSKIWYMIDGVYSMYGDVAPVEELNVLMQKYPQLHLYVDDAHGMSWHGTHGCGRVYEALKQNERTVYVSTLAKGFGTMGGIVVFPKQEWYDKVIMHGGPLAYSHPIPPPMMGASIASAEIHLSDEIYSLQNKLKNRLDYANGLLDQIDIPVLSYPDTPIYFIGTGQPAVGYNLNKRILQEGFYVNIGMFPAVPVKNTGLRFTLTNHHTLEEIKAFIDAMAYHYPKALEEESKGVNDVRKAFGLPILKVQEVLQDINYVKNKLKLEVKDSIQQIDESEWNSCFGNNGNFDWASISITERAFQNNYKEEENWSFCYLVVKNEKGAIVAATFFSVGLFKDDLLSIRTISQEVEKRRLEEPYYLCSKSIIMGSLFSEGEHLFIDRTSSQWKKALDLILDQIQNLRERANANQIILRDFDSEDTELAAIFHDAGYFKITMPNSNVLFDLQREKDRAYIELLSAKSRRNIRYEVLKQEDLFEFEIKDELTKDECAHFYALYGHVAQRNLALNLFQYPIKLFELFNELPSWEFLLLRHKETGRTSAILSAFKSKESYFPVVIGIDYVDNEKHHVYKQLLYQLTLSARDRGFKQIHYGITADQEKRKLGAKQLARDAFVMVKDQYNMELLDKICV